MRKHVTVQGTEELFTSRFGPHSEAKGRNESLENFKLLSKLNFGEGKQ
jgi:hypothetical protein